MWLKLTDFQTFFGYFHVVQVQTVLERLHSKIEILQKNRKIPFKSQFLPILATFYEVKSHFEKSW
jgi:hypothetical protein